MRGYVVSIGAELLMGHLTDTNATFLAQELAAAGIELRGVSQVGDDRAAITATIRRALEEAELVICTGGIGPTEDDLTREAISDVAGETPTVDTEAVEQIRAYFAARGMTMPERNAKQAWTIPSAEILTNPIGTAPGWLVRTGNREIVAMPGVPREMFRMWREQALPRILGASGSSPIVDITLKTIGIGESRAEEVLHDLVVRGQPIVATYAKDDGVHIRVSAPESERSAVDATVAEIRERLGAVVYTTGNASLTSVIENLLRERNCTLGLIEVGNCGRLSALLMDTTETDSPIRGSLVMPQTTDVEPALPDRAQRLAQRARDHFNASLGLGLVVEVAADATNVYSGSVRAALAGEPESYEETTTRAAFADVQRRAAMTAADLLRRALLEPEPAGNV